MTHSEIDTLVRDWPEAARKGYQYYAASAEDAWYTDKLYWEMVGRGLGWLAQNSGRYRSPTIDYWPGDNSWSVGEASSHVGPSLLHAVSAAVLAAKEGKC